MLEIVNRDNPVLREKAKEVPVSQIGKPEIQKIISEMKEALATQDDGVAIAAPQIGEPLRIFVVSGKILAQQSKKVRSTKKDGSDLVFINPKIIKLSRKKDFMEEGCLSVRWLYGRVKRSENATVEAYNEKAEKITRGASGLLAQVFQHEVDHLEGILFIDKAKDIVEIPPKKLHDK
ncbi:MAG: peptide deformylase [Candidatus Paceibacterota bacterium]|jgi:peptide deformylase